MTADQSIALYLQLTADIRSLWFAFGGLAVLFVGWLLARKEGLRVSQRLALTIGWFACAGYLASALNNRYILVNAVIADAAKLPPASELASAIASLSAVYSAHTVFVLGAVGALSLAAMLLVWTNVATTRSA